MWGMPPPPEVLGQAARVLDSLDGAARWPSGAGRSGSLGQSPQQSLSFTVLDRFIFSKAAKQCFLPPYQRLRSICLFGVAVSG